VTDGSRGFVFNAIWCQSSIPRHRDSTEQSTLGRRECGCSHKRSGCPRQEARRTSTKTLLAGGSSLPSSMNSDVLFVSRSRTGRTETSFSGLWAKLLVRSYVEGRLLRERSTPPFGNFRSDGTTLSIDGRSRGMLKRNTSRCRCGLPRLHLRTATVQGRASGRLLPLAIAGLVQSVPACDRALPLQHASDFSNCPFLLSSNPSGVRRLVERLMDTSGRIVAEDCSS